MYTALSLLFTALILAGTFLTLVLFKFDLSALKQTGLDKKILMWIPFALLFMLVLYLGPQARMVVFAVILTASLFEFSKVSIKGKSIGQFVPVYYLFYSIALLHLGLLRFVTPDSTQILMFTIVGTVVSDVCGFFFGKFFGRHKLPEAYNKNKSWEGVFGQIAGALIGVLLIKYFVVHAGSILIFLPIGIGSALGDLANSRAKKATGIQNWSNRIPGHGGFPDRFCSLAGSSLLVFYYVLFFLR